MERDNFTYPVELLLVGVRLNTVVDVESPEYLLDLVIGPPPDGYLSMVKW